MTNFVARENYPSIGAQVRPLPKLMLRKVGIVTKPVVEEDDVAAPMAATLDGAWFAVTCSYVGKANVIAIFEGRKIGNRKPTRWLSAKPPASPVIDICFTRAHSSEQSPFPRVRLVATSITAISVWDVETGILLFEAPGRCSLASPRVAGVTNSSTVVLWQSGERAVYEWNVGGDGVFSTVPHLLEMPCIGEVILYAAAGSSKDCSLGLCLATDRHLIVWRVGCPLLLDNSATAELVGKCQQLVVYKTGVAAILGLDKACLWSGISGDAVLTVALNTGQPEGLFVQSDNDAVFAYTKSGCCMLVKPTVCKTTDLTLPECTVEVLPVGTRGYVVTATPKELLYYDLLGGGGGCSIHPYLYMQTHEYKGAFIGCWILDRRHTVWKIVAISGEKAIARRMEKFDDVVDVVLNGIQHQRFSFMGAVSGMPGVLVGGTDEGALLMWNIGGHFFTGAPVSSIPSLSPFGKIIDVRRCAVMSAFSREYISTADAEPLVLAAMDNTTSVRVVKADVDQHGLVEGLREIIRLQSPSYQPGMVYGVVVELQPTSDAKLSELDAADEYMSVLFSCSQSRHEQSVHNEVWVVATGEKEWQWESDKGWPRGMDRYLDAPTVTTEAFALTQIEPYGFELTAAVPGAGLKTLRSSTEEATIKTLLKEKYCYAGLRSDEGWLSVDGEARGAVDGHQQVLEITVEKTSTSRRRRKYSELTRRCTVHPNAPLDLRANYRSQKERQQNSRHRRLRRSESSSFPRRVMKSMSNCNALKPQLHTCYNAVVDFLLNGPHMCPYFGDAIWVCQEGLVAGSSKRASSALLADLRGLLRILEYYTMDHCNECRGRVLSLCRSLSLDFSEIKCIYFLGVCADVAPTIFTEMMLTDGQQQRAAEVGHRLLQAALSDGDSVAAETLIRGYTRLVARVWKPERRKSMLVETYRVYNAEPRRANMCLQILLRAGLHDPLEFISTFSDLAVEGDDGTTALLILLSLLHKYPRRLRRLVPEFAEAAVLRCLDPVFPLRRRNCLITATSALHEMVKTFPNTAFDQSTQRFAVAKDAAIIVYDLRTASKWRVFEGHSGDISAIAFDPTGAQLASYSAQDATLRIDQCGSTGFFGGILRVAGKLLLTRQLQHIQRGGTDECRCRLIWRSRGELLLTREDNTTVLMKTSDDD